MSIIGRPTKTTAGTIAASRTSASDKEKEAAFRAAFDSKGARHQILLQTNPDRRAAQVAG
jgi:hypothetical protein